MIDLDLDQFLQLPFPKVVQFVDLDGVQFSDHVVERERERESNISEKDEDIWEFDIKCVPFCLNLSHPKIGIIQ